MKRLFLPGALLALTLLLVSSCTSPTDVPAGRKETTDPALSPIRVEQTKDIGTVNAKTPHTFLVEISNSSTTEPVIITDIRLKSGAQGFELVPSTLPHTLAPQGTATSSLSITVIFTASAAGSYKDEIVINNNESLTCEVHALVLDPAIIVSDLDFGTIEFGNKRIVTGQIINQGDAPATITAGTVSGSSAISAHFILLDPALPVYIPAGSVVDFSVVYSPQQAGDSIAELVFDIEYDGTGAVDNVSLLTGTATP